MRRAWAIMLAATLAGCAARPLPQLEPARVKRAGALERFGPGPVAMSPDGRHLRLRTSESAYFIIYNAHPDGWAERLGSVKLTSGEREIIVPLVRGGGGTPATGAIVPVCAASGPTNTERAASAERCSAVRGAADAAMAATQTAGRSPYANRRDALVIIAWSGTNDAAIQLGLAYDMIRIPDPADFGQLLPAALLRPDVEWASWVIAP